MSKPIIDYIAHMHNFIVKFGKILDIFKEFAGNRVNEFGNVPRRGVVPKFSDLEVLALSATAEVFGIDSENYHPVDDMMPDQDCHVNRVE